MPVSEVLSDFKGKRFTYWVYGHDNLVFNPDYIHRSAVGAVQCYKPIIIPLGKNLLYRNKYNSCFVMQTSEIYQ